MTLGAKCAPSRRTFMVSATGLAFSIVAHPGETLAASWEKGAREQNTFNPWVTMAADGMVSIVTPCHEMGQGSWTSIPAILADELDTDWNRVNIVRCPPDTATYGAPLGSPNAMLITLGSNAVSAYFAPMRKFGRQVRHVLLDNAAKHWGVPVGELSTAPHTVIHTPTGRRLDYGDIAKFMELPQKAPEITDEDLKKPEEWRFIGKDLIRIDVPGKINGTAQFSIDVIRPNMVYAAIARTPVQDGIPDKIDDKAAKKIKGVITVMRMPDAVAVVAETPWAAFEGKAALAVTWTRTGRGWGFNSETAHQKYLKVVRDTAVIGSVMNKAGDVDAALKTADEIIDMEYFCDFAYHAQMEPLNAVAEVAPDGQSAEIWAGVQGKGLVVDRVSEDLRIKPQHVKVNDMLMGGGFGRRAGLDMEYVMDAALLSRDLKRPVKAMWTREDDVRNGKFHPLSAHYLRAGLDKSGRIVAWQHRKASDEPLAFYDPIRFRAPLPDYMSFGGMDLKSYDIANFRNEAFAQKSGIRVCGLRAIGYTANKSASEVFVDEICRRRKVDPLEFRLDLLKSDPDAVAVLKAVAQMSNWEKTRPKDVGLGLSFVYFSKTAVALVTEVKVNRTTGEVSPLNVWAAVDPGIAVQPNNCIVQLEGSAIWGLGLALWERVTITDGVVDQSGFYDYFPPRMKQIPPLHINLMPSNRRPPSGISEMTTPGVPAAISNAIYDAVGVRVNHQPFIADRVLTALKGKA